MSTQVSCIDHLREKQRTHGERIYTRVEATSWQIYLPLMRVGKFVFLGVEANLPTPAANRLKTRGRGLALLLSTTTSDDIVLLQSKSERGALIYPLCANGSRQVPPSWNGQAGHLAGFERHGAASEIRARHVVTVVPRKNLLDEPTRAAVSPTVIDI